MCSDPIVIYIHGFNSSPLSRKAQQTRQWVLERSLPIQVWVPALSYGPAEAMTILEQLVQQAGANLRGLIGSSLGGYYATYLAEKYAIPTALVNPAVRPYELLADYLGENSNIYTGERYELTHQHVEELIRLDVPQIQHPREFFLLTQLADETLDARQAVAKFSQSPSWIEAGGTHEFQGFDRTLPAIFNFFGLMSHVTPGQD